MSFVQSTVPLDGSVNVLPGFLDFHAEHSPLRPFIKFPTKDRQGEETTVTYLEFANATHRVAYAVRPDISEDDGAVVAILVHCDSILYMALLVGMIRAGMIPFPISPRNSPEGVVHMLEKTNCHRMIVSKFTTPLYSAVQRILLTKEYRLQIDRLPSIDTVFPTLCPQIFVEELEVTHYPPTSTPTNTNAIAIILHSSGSTGLPKPILQTRKILLQWARSSAATYHRGHYGGVGAAMLPTFHSMGIFVQLIYPLSTGHWVGLYAPQDPGLPTVPNSHNMLDVLRVTGCTTTVVVPAMLEGWAQSQEATRYLASLEVVAYAGGPISHNTGLKLSAAGLNLVSVYGSTEAGITTVVPGPEERKKPVDWVWMSFDNMYRCRWVGQGNGTYELQFISHEGHLPAVENLPDIKGYATSDLFVPHPAKEGLWRVAGRIDDVLVLSSGEKVVPIPQEIHLSSTPLVSGAVVFGRGKPQVGMLIEPKADYAVDPKDEDAVIEFRRKLWPYVEEANKLGPSFARIFKEMIIITDPDKPMPRSGKGGVQRRAAILAYSDKIEELYIMVGKSRDTSTLKSPTFWNVKSVEGWLLDSAASINGDQILKADDDLFEQGFDSLSATFLRNRIIGCLHDSDDINARQAAGQIQQEFVFENPTIHLLASAIVSLIQSSSVVTHESIRVTELISKFSTGLPPSRARIDDSVSIDTVVILTGSTGSLGAHLLAILLKEPQITKVFTLDRGEHIAARQKRSFSEKALPTTILASEKLIRVTVDLSRDDLGIDSRILDEIQSSTTHIIHNAWKVDFNLSLLSFESYISATRRLINLAIACRRKVKFLFTSSISIAGGWDASKGPVPEAVIDNESFLSRRGRGYECSKYVVEHILANVNNSGVLDTTVLRIGQISGSTETGAWNPGEWVPSIVKTGYSIGALPLLEGTVSWIPMDTVCHTIQDLIMSPAGLPRVVNIVHPHPVSWSSIFHSIGEYLPLNNGTWAFLSFDAWLEKIEADGPSPSTKRLQEMPALKLLPFLRAFAGSSSLASSDIALFSTSVAQSLSPAIKNGPIIDDEQVKRWLSYWESIGFIQSLPTSD